MKKILMLLALAFALASASAQTYTGTMTIGTYTQHNVKVDVQRQNDSTVALTLRHVKFARLMPVRLDVRIAPVRLSAAESLHADGAVPTAKGKSYEKYTVRRLTGHHAAAETSFTCQMGTKKMRFSGRRNADR